MSLNTFLDEWFIAVDVLAWNTFRTTRYLVSLATGESNLAGNRTTAVAEAFIVNAAPMAVAVAVVNP